MFRMPEQFRIVTGRFATSKEQHGTHGAFVCRSLKFSLPLRVIASNLEGWEHVSASTALRCPTWEEMCWIKDLFWEEEDCVMQLHPPRSEWVSNMPFCLHLWRPAEGSALQIPRPPALFVGVKDLGQVWEPFKAPRWERRKKL